MGQTMRGTIHPLLLETIRLSSPGTPTHLSTVDFSPLLESAHPANLINIIADYVAPRSQWELRAKRYRRYEALCAPLSLSPGYPERIIHRQTCHRGFSIHEKPLCKREKGKKNCRSDNRETSLLIIIRSRVNWSNKLVRNLPILHFNHFRIIGEMYLFHRHSDTVTRTILRIFNSINF